jgi:uncharacterized protein YjbI with pentapeptide repeats
MKVRIHRERPDPWAERKRQIAPAWTLPFWFIEWIFEWIAFALSRWTFLDVLEYLEGFSVLVAVIFYFSESGDRLKQKHYQAWQVINTAQGKGGSGGRIEALEELNSDRISLLGVDVSGAFLQGLRLERARLQRADFSAADLRDCDLVFADLSDAKLRSTNFRQGNLRNVTFQRAYLEEADFTDANLTGANFSDAHLKEADFSGADLSGATLADADLTNATLSNLRWREIRGVQNANITGIKDPPDGFVAWALQHGAVVPKPPESHPSSVKTP